MYSIRYHHVFLSLALLNIGCHYTRVIEKKQLFKELDFSYTDYFTTSFSIKFTHTDTVFIFQHFVPEFSNKLKSNSTYYSILTQSDREKLDSLIKEVVFSKLDTLYWQGYEDGLDYQFFYEDVDIKKTIRVHSDSVPPNLNALRIWIVNTTEKLILHETTWQIKFGSLRDFLPPPIKVPPDVEFVVPKVEK